MAHIGTVGQFSIRRIESTRPYPCFLRAVYEVLGPHEPTETELDEIRKSGLLLTGQVTGEIIHGPTQQPNGLYRFLLRSECDSSD